MPILVTSPSAPGSATAFASLHVLTLTLHDDVVSARAFVERIPGDVSAAWLTNSTGLVARGECLRVTASGPERFTRISQDFSHVCAHSHVTDRANVRGSGLTGFLSMSYADSSARESRLVIPRRILGVTDEGSFLTFISTTAIEEPSRAQVEEELARFATPPVPEIPEVEIVPGHSPTAYQHLVGEAVERIAAGDAEKVVLSERFTITLGETNSRDLLPHLAGQLASTYTSAWTYVLDDLVGASPEMLVKTSGRQLFSRVLAGSRPVADGGSLSPEERTAFLSDAKERSEHAYAVDSVSGPLAPLTTELTVSEEPFILQLPGLEHLASDITGVLEEGTGIMAVAERLHPSAAVSGTPRAAANAIIAELETCDRGGYASPVGWLGASGDGELAIALRMAHVSENALTVQAGGGLVRESDPLTEHAEVLAKTRPIVRALGALDRRER